MAEEAKKVYVLYLVLTVWCVFLKFEVLWYMYF